MEKSPLNDKLRQKSPLIELEHMLITVSEGYSA